MSHVKTTMEVDDGSDDPPTAQQFPGRLSAFIQSRLSVEEFPILREVAFVEAVPSNLDQDPDVPTSGLILVAKTPGANSSAYLAIACISLSPGHALLPFTRGKVLGGHEDLRLQMAAGKVARHSESKIAWAREYASRLQSFLCFELLGRGGARSGGLDVFVRFKLLARMALGAKLLSMAAVSIGTGRRVNLSTYFNVEMGGLHETCALTSPVVKAGKGVRSLDMLGGTFLHRYRLAFWAPSNGRQPDTPLEANECRLPLSPPMREALRFCGESLPGTPRLSNWISGDPFDLKPFNDY
ncbi:hypothetical protein AK812_SmicGene32834 [Symbiodinium microadriaticum]|uniref:Uncharacterized protein n=1 Tax=Symbiodinium microadriaticum TaxID=2951 RepID=A0A1Q9CT46_SYMMI|nr:hypothetical protein AK812_SmicGene32834 [Symbiodinium microadriaticum]